MKFALLILLSASGVVGAQQPFAPDSAVRAIIEERVASKRAMGIVVGVLEEGKPPRIIAAGVSGVSGVPLDGNTVFEIGSITKAFTGSLLAEMVLHGEVRLDDPIAKYLPRSVTVPSRNGRQITLLDLATQTSGLPRIPGNMRPGDPANPYADYTVEQLYDFLAHYTLPRDAGAEYEYSNLGVGLLGHVLALAAGKSYGALVTERILDPLGMHDTGIELTPSMKARLAQGFNALGTPTRLWDLPTLAGAGALRSTASDMLRFLAANLDSPSTSLGAALAQARLPRRDADRPGNSIGLAWHIVKVFGTTLTWHNGGTGGFRTLIGLDEGKKRGVIVLTNSTRSPDDIGFHLLEPGVALDMHQPPPRERREISLDPSKLDPYVGVYELAPGFELAITKEGGLLYGQATGQEKLQLFAESDSDFFVKGLDLQISFVRGVAGEVSGLVLHQGGGNIPGRRVK
jgi:D-alanyl-D-alanine-carboxypeptidase/D-alanyl-D-alanine-endopeptidase